MAGPVLRLRAVSKRFGTVRAVRGVDLDVMPGTVHGLIGENGAGKSTLASIVFGLQKPDEGTLEIDGRAVSTLRPAEAIARGIGMVHQHFMLVPGFSVLENVVLGLEGGFRLRPGLDRARTRLGQVCREHGLDVDPDATVDDLPVGVRQRVEILKALYRGARILILDEPTGTLAPHETEQLLELLRRMRSAGATVLLITHKLQEIMAVCDRVSVMRAGRLVAERSVEDTSAGELAALMVGSEPAPGGDPRRQVESRTVLEVTGLGVEDQGGTRLDDVSFELRAGEVLGLAGVSGNGQSELLEVLAGMRPVSSGTVTLGRRRIDRARPASPAEMRALGVAHVPEDRQRQGLVLPFDIRENAVLGRLGRAGPGMVTRPAALLAQAQTMIAEFDIRPPVPERPAAVLSGGNQQKVVVARETAETPTILLLGQPTRGVDIATIALIHSRIIALRNRGCALLLVSADLDEIFALSDRIVTLCAGRLAGPLETRRADRSVVGRMMAGLDGGAAA